jgi:hypothetical protein
MDPKAARRVMFSSYIYLPVVFFALLASKVQLPEDWDMAFNNVSSLFF